MARPASTAASRERVPLAEVEPGATVLVRAGERVPVDGVVLAGESELDRSRLTGEPLPAAVGVGDEVWAGTVNLTGLLRVRVERRGAETLAGRLAALAEDAAFAKSHAQRVADAVAAVFVPVVIAIAAATAADRAGDRAADRGRRRASGRRARGLVPVRARARDARSRSSNAIGAGSRHGLLLRGGPALERAGHIATVAFDKTGTLTGGAPVLAGVLPADLAEEPAVAHARARRGGRGRRPAPGGGGDRCRRRRHAPAATSVHEARAAVERRAGAGLVGDVDGVRVLVGSERLLAEEGVALPAADCRGGARGASERRARGVGRADGRAAGRPALRRRDPARGGRGDRRAARGRRADRDRERRRAGDVRGGGGRARHRRGARRGAAAREGARRARARRDAAARLRSWATASTTRPRSGRPTWRSRWAAAPTWRCSRPTWCSRGEGSPLSAMPALLQLAGATRRVIVARTSCGRSPTTWSRYRSRSSGGSRRWPRRRRWRASSLAVVANSWRLRFAIRDEKRRDGRA